MFLYLMRELAKLENQAKSFSLELPTYTVSTTPS